MRSMPLMLLVSMISTLVNTAPSHASDRQFYGPCVPCHGPNGWGSVDGKVPNIAGQHRRYLEQQLALFKNGARIDVAMQLFAAHPRLSDRENVAAIARYLADLEPNPNPVQGPGAHLRLGLETYVRLCSGCHGSAGQGDAGNRIPRIAGQHYPYLQRQIEAVARLHERIAPPEMAVTLAGMSAAQRDSLADYLSRLGG